MKETRRKDDDEEEDEFFASWTLRILYLVLSLLGFLYRVAAILKQMQIPFRSFRFLRQPKMILGEENFWCHPPDVNKELLQRTHNHHDPSFDRLFVDHVYANLMLGEEGKWFDSSWSWLGGGGSWRVIIASGIVFSETRRGGKGCRFQQLTLHEFHPGDERLHISLCLIAGSPSVLFNSSFCYERNQSLIPSMNHCLDPHFSLLS